MLRSADCGVAGAVSTDDHVIATSVRQITDPADPLLTVTPVGDAFTRHHIEDPVTAVARRPRLSGVEFSAKGGRSMISIVVDHGATAVRQHPTQSLVDLVPAHGAIIARVVDLEACLVQRIR